jgi:SH3-like domain-containing protein
MLRRRVLSIALIAALAFTFACKRGGISTHEYAYVAANNVNVRDRLAAVYNKVATLNNGDKVEIIDRQKRFVKIKVPSGQEGWLEARYLIGQDVYDGFEKLRQDHLKQPIVGRGTTRAELNMHLTPARDSEHLYQLKDGEKVDVIERGIGEKKAAQANAPTGLKPKPKPAPIVTTKPGKPDKNAPNTAANGNDQKTPDKSAAAPPPAPAAKPAKPPEPEAPKVYEDWWLVRSSEGKTGWVLARMVDLDVPLEIAQYAEGQRIMAYTILNTVDEDGKQVPQYLVATNENKDGLPWDFNSIRVFTRNRARHRYETAYRERNLFGLLPIRTGTQEFEKEGVLPYFIIRTKDSAGQIHETKYKMNGPIVRRVLSPEDQARVDAERDKAIAERKARLGQQRAERKAKRAAAPVHSRRRRR